MVGDLATASPHAFASGSMKEHVSRSFPAPEQRSAIEHGSGALVVLAPVDQAKGLDFDAVVLADASRGEFSHFFSVKEGREDEERRLFYVGITRTERRRVVTCHRRDDGVFATAPSPCLTGPS